MKVALYLSLLLVTVTTHIVLAQSSGQSPSQSPGQAPSQLEMVAKSAAAAVPLKVGIQAPDASVKTLDDSATQLSKVLAGKPTVLIFYRGGWCPFCNAHLAALGQIEDKIEAKGYQIVAVTPDTPAELHKTLDKHHLKYTLLSDSTAEAMKRFGVAYRLDDGTFTLYKDKYGIDLERSSGKTHHILPVPSVFLINREGKITFVHSDPDYKVRMKSDAILEAIDRS